MPQSIREDFKRNNAISLYDLYDHARAKNPCPRVHKIYNLVDSSLVITPINLLCLLYAWEKRRRFLKEIMHFHYMTDMATPLHKKRFPVVMKFTILVGPPLVIITIYLFCMDYYILTLYGPCHRVEEKIF